MSTTQPTDTDLPFMRQALRLARKGYGRTSPNPMVGAIVVKGSKLLGQGYHHQAGLPHAEIEALRNATRLGHQVRGATLYVTLEPCSSHGRTPPCTQAILQAGIARVVAGATDPNPSHQGRGFEWLRKAGIRVEEGCLGRECEQLNEVFNHWIVHQTPFVTVKAAMTLDGKIATADGVSQWITSQRARSMAMRLRKGTDAILVGINTVLLDDPSLTVRRSLAGATKLAARQPLRIVLDSRGRTPLESKLLNDGSATLLVVTEKTGVQRRRELEKKAEVLVAPNLGRGIDLPWLVGELGRRGITSLLVEGGGEVCASFLEKRLVQRVAFFYAPKVLGGKAARKGVAGEGAADWKSVQRLEELEWSRVGPDLFLTARVRANS